MADSLHDGHTSFLTPDEAARSHETSFAGIGVLMSRPEDHHEALWVLQHQAKNNVGNFGQI